MDAILLSCGLSDLKECFSQNRVTPKDVLSLRDEEFKFLGVVRVGDRTRLRVACQQSLQENVLSSPVVARIRSRQADRRPLSSRSTSEVTTYRIYTGWKHKAEGGTVKLISVNKGGGRHAIDVNKNASLVTVKSLIEGIFFPERRNEVHGTNLESCLSHLTTFNGQRLSPTLSNGLPFTLAGYVKEKATHPIRLYLQTEEIESEEIESSSHETASVNGNNLDSVVGAPSVDANCDLSQGVESSSHETASVNGNNPHSVVGAPTVDANSGLSQEVESSSHETASVNGNNPHSVVGAPTVIANSGLSEEVESSSHETASVKGNIPDSVVGAPTVDANSGLSQRNVTEAEPMELDTLPDLDETETTPGSALEVSDSRAMATRSRLRLRPRLSVSRVETTINFGETLRDAMQRIERRVDHMSKNVINIDRQDVLDGTFRGFARRSFDPWKRTDVRFVEEDGIDGGGPMREFMRLAVKELASLPIFAGDEKKTLVLDYNSLKKKVYFKAGQILAYCIVHRGPLPRLFSNMMYSALADIPMAPTMEDVVDFEIRSKIKLVSDAVTEETFRFATEEASELIALSGCGSLAMRFDSKEDLVQSLCHFSVLCTIRQPLEQFKSGLQTLGLADEIARNPEEWREVFVPPEVPVQLDHVQVESIFAVEWSEAGGNRRRAESRTMTYWRDFLQDLQEGMVGPTSGTKVALKDLLIFATGAERVPHMGFPTQPTLKFIHPGDVEMKHMKGLPTTNTCAMQLNIPIVSDFDTFQANMLAVLDMVTTFTTQ